MKKLDLRTGYRFSSHSASKMGSAHTILGLAFSGGRTRGAAFAYGVLEELRDTQVTIDGKSHRLLDQVDKKLKIKNSSGISEFS